MNRVLRVILVFGFFTLLIGVGSSYAQVIEKVEIRGNKMVDRDVIEEKITSKKGKRFSQKKVQQDVKNIFATGLFDDIQVEKKKVGKKIILLYTLVEKPIISGFEFRGNDEIGDDELKEAVGFKEYKALDESQLRLALPKIKKLYEAKGFFLAEVDYVLEKNKKTKAFKVVIKIDEKKKIRIKTIKILGAKKISASKIKSAMKTEEEGFFSFLTDSGTYQKEIFDRDLQIISLLYFNKGFVQAKVAEPDILISPNKKAIHITIRVHEGEKFEIGDISFSGDVLFQQSELEDSVKLKTGDVFSYVVLQKDLKSLQSMYGDLGYAFANPVPRTQIRAKEKLVNITFSIEKGPKVYIGEINIKGNTKTRDKVLRREFLIEEGDIFNETKKRTSLANVKRLGFFEEINFVTNTPRGRYDLMNVDLEVKERSTGTIQIGAGYSGLQGFLLNGQVNQINFLGRGQRLGVSANLAREEQVFNISFTDPYVFDSNWEVGFDIYRRNRGLFDYLENKTGGGVRLGYPLAPYLKGVFGYRLDNTKLTLLDTGDEDIFRVETANGVTSLASVSLVYDQRNDRFFPTDGFYGNVTLEYAGLGGDLDYTKVISSFRFYKNLFWDIVWRNHLNYGLVRSNSSKDAPFNQLHLLGGAYSLRGFEWFSIGKRVFSKKAFGSCVGSGMPTKKCENAALRPFGGEQQLYYQGELQFPLARGLGMQGVVFFDIGEAQDKLNFGSFRSNVGFGFRWFSPIGPLRFEWGFPINRKRELGEGASEFHFSLGPTF